MPYVLIKSVTVILLVVISVEATFRSQNYSSEADDTFKWIRLCTLTSNGSSQFNVSMPCSVHLESNDDRDSTENGHDYGSADRQEDLNSDIQKGNETQTEYGEMQDEDIETQDDEDETQVDSGQLQDEDREVGGPNQAAIVDRVNTENLQEDHGNENGYPEMITGGKISNPEIVNGDQQYEADYVIVEVEDDDGGGEREEGHKSTPVKEVMLTYIQNARDQLYDKIHYLLNLLRRVFLNVKVNRRSRRNQIGYRKNSVLDAQSRQARETQSMTSTIMKPTFERSMMTMSFLMFGVFVIQVVQRLLQTLQSSGITSVSSDMHNNNLLTASASIF